LSNEWLLTAAPGAASDKSKAINEIWRLEKSQTKIFFGEIGKEVTRFKSEKIQDHSNHRGKTEKLPPWPKSCDFLIFELHNHQALAFSLTINLILFQ
jgi:hypothetical protein